MGLLMLIHFPDASVLLPHYLQIARIFNRILALNYGGREAREALLVSLRLV